MIEIDLDFIPTDLEGNPIDNVSCAKRLAELLLDNKNTENVYQRYLAGKQLYETGKLTLPDNEESLQIIAYLKKEFTDYKGEIFTNLYKGRVLDKLTELGL